MTSKLFLVGDSHAAVLGRAARRAGYQVSGGPLAGGRCFEDPFFTIEGDRLVISARFNAAHIARFDDLLCFDGPILSTLGFNAHRFGALMGEHMRQVGCQDWRELLSERAFAASVLDLQAHVLALYRALVERNRQVWAVHSPQRPYGTTMDLHRAAEEVMIDAVASIGVGLIDVRHEVMSDGHLRAEYAAPDDPVHGSDAFGDLVIARFGQALGAA